jgi:protein-L-isoaspartate(D-aspartate) O-methyltransferase
VGPDSLDELHERLIERLRKDGYLRTGRVIQAMRQVRREAYTVAGFEHYAYDDAPMPIGQGQTMSAPHMVAMMAEALDVPEGAKVLEVGTGSGYHAAVLARLVGPRGSIVSVEYESSLARAAKASLAGEGVSNVVVHEADGAQGWPNGAPYDRVSVTCAVPKIPAALLTQLAADGVLVAPVGRDPSRLLRIRRKDAKDLVEDLGACAFVPLRGPSGFPDRP